MPTTTSCRRYPYPLDPDPPDVANDIGKLARAIDADACTLAARLGNSEAVALNAVKRAGDAMTGALSISSPSTWQLALRRSGTSVDQPTLSFQSLSGTPEFGSIVGDAGGMNYKIVSNADTHTFLIANIEKLVLANALATLSTNLNVKGQIEAQNAAGNQLYLVDNNGGRNCYLSLYGDGTASATGAQSAAIGFNGSSRLFINNAIANGEVYISTQGTGPITLTTAGAGDITLDTGTGGEINFQPNGAFQGKMTTNGLFMWGKAAPDSLNAGIEMYGTGSAEGRILATTGAVGQVPLRLTLVGAAYAEGAPWIQFADAAGAVLSSFTVDDAAPKGLHASNFSFSAPSDYRLKDVLGPISGALEDVADLKPVAFRWKDAPEVMQQGFLAHEVAEVVPTAVYGERDGPELQQLDPTKLIPLLTAAIIELLERVENLEAERG